MPTGPLSVSEITSTSVTIAWNAPSLDGGISLSAYIIERRDIRYKAWLLVEKVRPTITSYCVQNLLEGNEYLFRVIAENEEGQSEPLQLSDTVRLEGIPKGLNDPGFNLFLLPKIHIPFLLHVYHRYPVRLIIGIKHVCHN